MDKATRYALNEERKAIERVIHAYAALDNYGEGDIRLSQAEVDEYLDTIRGVNFPKLSRRYVEIQNAQWEAWTGRPIPGGEVNLSYPDADYREIVAPAIVAPAETVGTSPTLTH